MIARRIRFAFSLRLRLLTSYLVLLMVALGVIALALFVLIGNRPSAPGTCLRASGGIDTRA